PTHIQTECPVAAMCQPIRHHGRNCGTATGQNNQLNARMCHEHPPFHQPRESVGECKKDDKLTSNTQGRAPTERKRAERSSFPVRIAYTTPSKQKMCLRG